MRRCQWAGAGLHQMPVTPKLIPIRPRRTTLHTRVRRILPNGHNSGDMDRQNTYLEALSTFPQMHGHTSSAEEIEYAHGSSRAQ
jgi:hypothetical protein